MTDVTQSPAKKPRRAVFNWWSIDPSDIAQGVADYGKPHQARHVAAYAAFAFAAFNAVASYNHWLGEDEWNFVDAGLLAGLGAATYRGHRWAMILAMLYWTFCKGQQIFNMANAPTHGNIVTIIIFWGVLMGPMWRAFLIERAVRKVAAR
jgi:hypothetical protein